jgi:hypothetical protein
MNVGDFQSGSSFKEISLFFQSEGFENSFRPENLGGFTELQ